MGAKFVQMNQLVSAQSRLDNNSVVIVLFGQVIGVGAEKADQFPLGGTDVKPQADFAAADFVGYDGGHFVEVHFGFGGNCNRVMMDGLQGLKQLQIVDGVGLVQKR